MDLQVNKFYHLQQYRIYVLPVAITDPPYSFISWSVDDGGGYPCSVVYWNLMSKMLLPKVGERRPTLVAKFMGTDAVSS